MARKKSAPPSTVGERLLAARDKAKLTQAQVAARSGRSSSFISDIERGRRDKVSLEILYEIAIAIGCSPHDLDPRLVDRIGG